MREGLTRALADAAAAGAADGTRDAARVARHEPVRATALPTDARREAFERAVSQMFEDRDLTTREDF
jgi:hypothetical protein